MNDRLHLVPSSSDRGEQHAAGPLRTFIAIEGRCGFDESWKGTHRELGALLELSEKTISVHVAFLEERAQVIAWERSGGGKPGTVYLRERGQRAYMLIEAAGSAWTSGLPFASMFRSGLPELPVLPEVSAHTESSSSASSSSALPELPVPEGSTKPIPGRLLDVGIPLNGRDGPRLLSQLKRLTPDFVDVIFEQLWQRRGTDDPVRSPAYVLSMIESERQRRLAKPSSPPAPEEERSPLGFHAYTQQPDAPQAPAHFTPVRRSRLETVALRALDGVSRWLSRGGPQ